MKKYIFLAVSTCLLIGISFWIPQMVLSSYPEVKLIQLQTTYSQDTVSVSGKIQEENQTEITTDFPLVIDQVLVKEGDVIEIGDCLATVDQPATKDSLSSLSDTIGQKIPQEFSDRLSGLMDQEYGIRIPSGIYATAKGVVTAVNLQAHAISPIGQPAVILSDLSVLQVKAQAGESQISDLAVGQPAIVTGTALGDSSYSAVITEIAPTATTRMNGMTTETVVDITLAIEETDDTLKPGYQVDVTIVTGDANRLMAPYQSIGQDESGQEYVYIYQDGKAVRRNVTTGKEEEDMVEIVSGVSAGEWMITEQDKISGNEVSVFATKENEG